MKSFLRPAFFSALLFSASTSLAGYTIQRVGGGPNTLVQGREYSFEVISTPPLFDNVILQGSGNYAIMVSPGIQVGPNEYKMDSSGKISFIYRPDTAPGNLTLTATNANDSTINTTVILATQRYPVTFSISPSLPTIDANNPFSVTVTALDGTGNFVSAFEDSIQITDSQLGDVTSISGSSFVNGSATTLVNVKAGDMNNKVRLTVDLVGIQYFNPALPGSHLVPPATFTTPDLNLIPAPYNKVVMLFPGELLVPGIGKDSSSIITQVGNIPVSNVIIWPVDAFFNPIRSVVNLDIAFTSSNGLDAMPANRLLTNPPLNIDGGAVDPFMFISNGLRTITATPNGAVADSDTSDISVAPGASNIYEFSIQPVGPYTTDSVFQVQVTARDIAGNVLTTLFGQLPNAQLSARTLGIPIQENTAWVDTNPASLIPDNVVNFSAGVATLNMLVTKRASQIQLHFQDQYGVGVFSDVFQSSAGAVSQIQLTILGRPGELIGETFTPGTYPGNSGTVPLLTAGEQVVVEARVTDRHWNILSGPSIDGTSIQLDDILPDNYISATHPDDPNVIFDQSGELIYKTAPFDRSFRVTVRTAGQNRRFRATSGFSSSSFLSSTMTVQSANYSRLVFQAPGETIRPGSDFTSGKEGSITVQGAGVSFPMTVYATDAFWNPISNGPYPTVRFSILPPNVQNFINGVTLGSPVAMPGNSRIFTVNLAADSDVRVTDNSNSSITQMDTIDVGAGLLDHFTLEFSAPGTKEAGIPYQVTIEAEDKFNQVIPNYNNTINLEATTGAGTMSPTTVAITNGQFVGDLTNFAAGTGIQIRMSRNSVISLSAPFDVSVNSGGFQRLLVLGPGESHFPGTATGKSGANAPTQVGIGINVKAIACDLYYNKLNISGNQVSFLSNNFAIFSPPSGIIATGEFTTTFVMHAATAQVVTALEPTLSLVATTTITGNPGPYARVQILAPGEIAQPGNVATLGKNPANSPLAQRVSVPFNVTIQAVDQFFNLTTFNGGDTFLSLNTVNGILLPTNNALNGPTPRSFVNGTMTRGVLVGEQGSWIIDARDQDDLTKLPMKVEVNFQPGPAYVFTVPATVTAGQPFNVMINLEEGGVPLAGYNQSVFLEAYFPAGGPASGAFNPDGSPREYVMNNGQVVINDLTYAHVEDIQIRLTDNFSRVVFSNTITVNPSGLKYEVSAPPSAIAGPPQTFNVTVRLLDLTTETLVKNSNYNHTIGVDVISLLNPLALGALSLSQAPLTQGVASLLLSYSKAEEIKIEISDLNNAFGVNDGFSGSILVGPDGYKKLLILAPGETHTPGLYQHPTGKSGTPQILDRSLSHVFQTRGVDQHWNTASNFSSGSIFYQSDDGSVTATNPVNQNTPLVNGQTAAAIVFNTAGNVNLTVRDNADFSIVPQSVLVPVAGSFYDITVPAQQNTGAPFTMVITLRDTGGNTIPAFGPVQIEALKPDGTPASGVLDVTSANLSNGVVTISNQRYTIARDIRLRITGHDTTSISSVIHFVPRAIYYVYKTIPSNAEVNVAFDIVIQAMDQDTGTEVVNFSRQNLPLTPFSALTGNPAAGVFNPTTINIDTGTARVSAFYNTAESIYLVLTDNTTVFDPPPLPTQANYPSPSTINVAAGALARVDIADFSLQSNETRTFDLVARDAFGNPIANQTLAMSVNAIQPPGQMFMNGKPNFLNQRTDSNGILQVNFDPSGDANGQVDILIADGDRPNGYSKILRINVQGLHQEPQGALDLDANRIPVFSTVMLDINITPSAGGTLRTFYRVDNGAWTPYNHALGITANDVSRGYTVFDQTRDYQIEYYTEVCYDLACSNPVSELSINGAPHIQMVSTYRVEDKINGYPSPFNPKGPADENYLTIQYPLMVPTSVEIDIFDLFGQKVWHKDINAGSNGGQARSDNRVFWFGINDDGQTVASGGYIVLVKAGDQTMKTKVLVVK